MRLIRLYKASLSFLFFLFIHVIWKRAYCSKLLGTYIRTHMFYAQMSKEFSKLTLSERKTTKMVILAWPKKSGFLLQWASIRKGELYFQKTNGGTKEMRLPLSVDCTWIQGWVWLSGTRPLPDAKLRRTACLQSVALNLHAMGKPLQVWSDENGLLV